MNYLWTSETRFSIRKHTLVWLNNAIERYELDLDTIEAFVTAMNGSASKWNG
jgi:hypothetical protein